MFRVTVLLTSTQGNPKEITTLCASKSEAKRRETMYKEKYPDADVFIDEIKDVKE